VLSLAGPSVATNNQANTSLAPTRGACQNYVSTMCRLRTPATQSAQPPGVAHSTLARASGIVAIRRKLERLKHADLGTEEERRLLAAHLNGIERAS
jgi:hypothetical protein